MPNTEEQRTDIIENCNILLNKFADHEQTDSTPEGRLIAQLNWLKERAINHDLPLDKVSVSTLAYIYTDGSPRPSVDNKHHRKWFWKNLTRTICHEMFCMNKAL